MIGNFKAEYEKSLLVYELKIRSRKKGKRTINIKQHVKHEKTKIMRYLYALIFLSDFDL